MMMPRSRASRFGEAALWCSACLVVLCAHLAGASVMLRQEPAEGADASPPAAIMIELAAEPEAAMTDETVVSEDLQDSQEVVSETTEPMEEPPPELVQQPVAEPPPEPPQEIAQLEEPPQPEEPVVEEKPLDEPVQETTQAIPEKPLEPIEPVDEPAQEQLAALENVEVPLPTVRPPEVEERPAETSKEEPKPAKKKVAEKPKPKPHAPAAKAAQQAKVEDMQPSTRTAAAATSSLGGRSMTPARWHSKLLAHIGRKPGGRCMAAYRDRNAYVNLRIDDDGNILAVSLTRSSGYSELDSDMVDLVRRASPVPPPPAGVNKNITIPLGYNNC